MAWFRGLRSSDYTEDLLRTKHGFTDANKTTECARAIAAHAESAVDYLEQAFSGPPRVSYLPIYYAMLDLAKVVVLSRGWLGDLQRHRTHGVSWSGIARNSHDLLTDHITVQEKGAFALFYKALVGDMWSKSGEKRSGRWSSSHQRRILMRGIYPYIESVSFEFQMAYGEESGLTPIWANLEEISSGRWRVRVGFADRSLPVGPEKKRYRILSGLTEESGQPDEPDVYVTRSFGASDDHTARMAVSEHFRSYLLYPTATRNGFVTSTPRSNSNFLLPEEVPCLLAFFHLGSVARYDPERLARLFDSKACAMLEILRRHGTYDYLLAVWSFLMQAQVGPSHP